MEWHVTPLGSCMSVNTIISDLPTLIGIGVTSGLASSLLTAFLTPRIQHRFWIQQQRFDSRFLNLKELHRLSVEIGRFQQLKLDRGRPQDDTKAVALVYSWRAATQQTRFLFSEQSTTDLAELDNVVSAILFGGLFEGLMPQEILSKFLTYEPKVFDALYQELFARRPCRWPFTRTFSR
jgi:hypothetical protein